MRGDTITSHSRPTSLQMMVSRTWAWLRETSPPGRNERRAGPAGAEREEWQWREVWTLRPACCSSLTTLCRENTGLVGEHRTTMSSVRPGLSVRTCQTLNVMSVVWYTMVTVRFRSQNGNKKGNVKLKLFSSNNPVYRRRYSSTTLVGAWFLSKDCFYNSYCGPKLAESLRG